MPNNSMGKCSKSCGSLWWDLIVESIVHWAHMGATCFWKLPYGSFSKESSAGRPVLFSVVSRYHQGPWVP